MSCLPEFVPNYMQCTWRPKWGVSSLRIGVLGDWSPCGCQELNLGEQPVLLPIEPSLQPQPTTALHLCLPALCSQVGPSVARTDLELCSQGCSCGMSDGRIGRHAPPHLHSYLVVYSFLGGGRGVLNLCLCSMCLPGALRGQKRE